VGFLPLREEVVLYKKGRQKPPIGGVDAPRQESLISSRRDISVYSQSGENQLSENVRFSAL
jgi:hypothetical protein